MAQRRKNPVEVPATEPHLCSRDLRLQILSGLPFFRSLSAGELEEANRLFREQGFAPGEYLYQAGDPAERLYVVAEGRVRLLRLALSGKQVMLDLLTPGEFFGALSPEETAYPDSAQAQTPVCALAVSLADFRGLLRRYPAVALDVLDAISARLQQAHDAIHLLSAEPAVQRVAFVLLRLAGKLGKADETGLLIQTPLGRDELAEMTGLTPETASRVISQLQRAGLIATGRQWVAIRDLAGLEARAAGA